MHEEVEIKINYKADDILQAYRFHYLKKINAKRDLVISFFILLPVCILGYFIGFNFFVILLLVLGGILFMLPISLYAVVPIAMCLMKKKLFQINTLYFSEKYIGIRINGNLHMHHLSDYHQMYENARYFILYSDMHNLVIIPKQSFADYAQMAEFRKFTGDKIKDEA